MSVTVDANGVTLTGDGFGVNWARKQLAAAPATAVKMQFVYRAYFLDNLTQGKTWTAKAWDSCAFLGLGFDNTIYDFASADVIAPTGFLGPLTTTKPIIGGPAYDNTRKSYGRPYIGASGLTYLGQPAGYSGSGQAQKVAIMDGIGGKKLEADLRDDVLTGEDWGFSFPNSATTGVVMTYMFEVWGSAIDKSVYLRWCPASGSLAEGDAMFTAMDGKTFGSIGSLNVGYETTIHGDTTSLWRNSDNTMNFPRWLKIKVPLPEYSLRLKYWKIRYLDASDTVVYEQAP
jgi:hypothetical protein